MAETAGMRRVRRTLVIHRIVQVVMLVLLLYMALLFQEKFQQKYASLKPFYTSLGLTLLIQVALFFPIRKFAVTEAGREVGAAAKSTYTAEEERRLRNQRLLSDFLKTSVFIFFAIFIAILQGQATVFHSTAFFCCIGTVLSYLQNFNHAARRQMSR